MMINNYHFYYKYIYHKDYIVYGIKEYEEEGFIRIPSKIISLYYADLMKLVYTPNRLYQIDLGINLIDVVEALNH